MSETPVRSPVGNPDRSHLSRKLTEGPITRTLLAFSLPVLGGNVLQSLNGSVNAIWVSHFLGEAGLTATSNANILLGFLIGAVFGIAMAANILIAQAVGGGDMARVKQVVGTSTIFFIGLSVLVAVLGAVFAQPILTAMKTPPDALPQAVAYLRVIFVAVPFLYFFGFMMMAQRGGGDSKTPFQFMALAVALDVFFNPMLIRGIGPFPRLGIAGAATSTFIANGVSLALMLVVLYRRKSLLLLRGDELRHLRPRPEILRALITKGLPMGLQMIVISAAAVVMIAMVNRYGSRVSAAYGAASQLWTYVQMPAMAIGAAVSSMAAQNIGAGRWDRVNRITASGVMLGLVVTGSIVTVIYLLGDYALHVFLPADSAAVAIGRHMNAFVLWAFVLFSITFILFGVVRATGAVFPPLIILFFSLWLIRIPFAQLLTPRIGADAIWWSFPLGTVTSAGLAALYFFFGNWRKAHFVELKPAGPAPDTGMAPPAANAGPERVSPEAAGAS